MAKETRRSVRLDADTAAWLGRVARATDRDVSWVIRWAVDEMRASGRAPTSKIEARHFPVEARKAGGA